MNNFLIDIIMPKSIDFKINIIPKDIHIFYSRDSLPNFGYYVYSLFSTKKLLYIGRATNVKNRIQQHKRIKDFEYISIFKTTKKYIKILEAFMIYANLPPLNKKINITYLNEYNDQIDFILPIMPSHMYLRYNKKELEEMRCQ